MHLRKLPISAITFGSKFKLVFLSGIGAWIFASLVAFLLNLVMPGVIQINGQAVSGFTGSLIGMVIIFLIGSIFAALGTLLGLGMLSLFQKNLGTIDYIDISEE